MAIRHTYDAEADALYIYLKDIEPGEAVRQVPVEGVPADSEVVLDYNADGILLGIEIIGASGSVPQSIFAVNE